jgi:hypothetical protein
MPTEVFHTYLIEEAYSVQPRNNQVVLGLNQGFPTFLYLHTIKGV